MSSEGKECGGTKGKLIEELLNLVENFVQNLPAKQWHKIKGNEYRAR